MNRLQPRIATILAPAACADEASGTPAFGAAPVDVARYAAALGLLLVLLVPAARGSHDVFGWLPLWLVGMPLAAWSCVLLAGREPTGAQVVRRAPLRSSRAPSRTPRRGAVRTRPRHLGGQRQA